MTIARNAVLTSNAIRRAYVDFDDKMFDSCLEVLDIATSFIEASYVADDERCKAMIRNLSDFSQSIKSEIGKLRSASMSAPVFAVPRVPPKFAAPSNRSWSDRNRRPSDQHSIYRR
jgi:hypothetical protein